MKKILETCDECTNELGTITSSYEYNGKVYYDIRLDNHEFDVIPTEFINLTPHDIKLNDGTIYPATGRIQLTHFCNGIAKVFYGDVENLPEPKRGTLFQHQC